MRTHSCQSGIASCQNGMSPVRIGVGTEKVLMLCEHKIKREWP
jgi:hypothetical protein